MFCNEVELGGFLGSIDVIPDAFRAISHLTSSSSSSGYQLHTSTSSGIQILAFNCSTDYTDRFLDGEFGLVSSETLQVLDFIPTKVNPSFSINKAAVELFQNLLVELKNQLINQPLIITGRSLGGYIAILFTLWLQHAIDVKEAAGTKDTKRPICITFGCPLVGDQALQKAISERPQWKSSFLNVVTKTDSVACFFSSNSPYKPFGTSLFCTESGGHTAFEDQESIMAVLDAMASSIITRNTEINYGNHLKLIRRKALYRGVSKLGEFNLNPLKAGIKWQFREITVLDNSTDLIDIIEEKQEKRIKSKRNAYEPTKKLNEMKISLTYMEWYMKTRRSKGGYYDCYKNAESKEEMESQQLIVKHQRILNQYWKKMVEEKDRMPQKEGAKLRKRWLYSANNYRRIIEPLDIAEYYKKGRKDYIPNRSNHYKLLENWSNDDKKDLNPSGRSKKAASLTEDSCFWAHVEEGLNSLRDLKNGGLSSSHADVRKEELEQFESKVMNEMKSCSVSMDVFLEGSSLMKWWDEYKKYKGSSYASEFAKYMNEERYKLIV